MELSLEGRKSRGKSHRMGGGGGRGEKRLELLRFEDNKVLIHGLGREQAQTGEQKKGTQSKLRLQSQETT